MKIFSNHERQMYYAGQDQVLFRKIYEEFYPLIYVYISRWIQQRDIAQDIVAGTFVGLWQSENHFRNRKALKAYLFITAKNAVLNQLKYMSRRQKVEKELWNEWISQKENAATEAVGAETRAELRDRLRLAVEMLPAKCRKVFEMSFFDELRNTEIAALLQISEKTVANQRSRATKLLKLSITIIHNSFSLVLHSLILSVLI